MGRTAEPGTEPDGHQPLTAPAVSPATIRFLKITTSTISGTVIVTVAALIVPIGIWNCELPVKNAIAADTGRRDDELVNVIESRNSFQAKMNASRPAVTSPGAASGTTTLRNAWNRVAPSTSAASSSSFGVSRKNRAFATTRCRRR